jgi:hypothetical protein
VASRADSAAPAANEDAPVAPAELAVEAPASVRPGRSGESRDASALELQPIASRRLDGAPGFEAGTGREEAGGTDTDSRSALGEPAATTLSSGQLPVPGFNGAAGTLFRTVSWDRARFERGESVPRIAGLPVVEVQLAGSRGDDSRPLMVVAQQLESGQVIRTIEGPATDVNQLLASQRSDDSSPWPTVGDDGITGADGAMAVRRGDRILAITAPLPSDSLRAMIRRLNASER